MIPFILAAVGGYLIYDSTRKAPNPLSNPYNILRDGGEIQEGDYVYVKPEKLNAEVLRILGKKVVVEFTDRRPEGGDKRGNYTLKQLEKIDDQSYAQGGKVGRFKILQDETGYVEQGFYGVFDTDNNELLDIFEFKKEAEGFVKELKDKGVSEADAAKFNGRIQNYVLKNGGKVKSKKWIQEALSNGKNKGALRRTAKKKGLLRGDENLSATDLKKLQKMGGTTAKRAYLAETLRKLK